MVPVRRQQDVPAPKSAGGPVFDNTRSGTRVNSEEYDPLPKEITAHLVARRREAATRSKLRRSRRTTEVPFDSLPVELRLLALGLTANANAQVFALAAE
jgi:hypothetical protein